MHNFPPYSVEVHSDSGHAFLPGLYEESSEAIAIARECQMRETDPSTSYLVSDRDQDIIFRAEAPHA